MPPASATAATAAATPDDSPAASVSSDEVSAALRNFSQAHVMRPPHRPPAPLLPSSDRRNVLVTSAIPYVNNVPHLGNIIGSVLSADVFARFCRRRDYNTLYICGTDEYGTQTETKALEEGLTPQQICDKYHTLHKGIYEWFGLSFDHFGRTTTEQQTKVAQDIFWQLDKAGNTLEDVMEQLYCEQCQKFLADRFVEGVCPMCSFEDARGDQCDGCGKLINATELLKPRCKLCSATPQIRTSRHIFLDLPKLESRLNTWLDKSSVEWSNNARVIAKSWLKLGLQPRCITRDLKWGTPVPKKGFEDKVFYVWFDAPIGYLSITACYTDEWKQWWKNPDNVEYYQFMAKDNVPFHSVVFPSTLIGTEDKWTLVNHLMATEYLNYEDAKFSKSRGIGVFGNQAMQTELPADVWRFYLLYSRPENQDSAFKWDDLLLKNNSELLGNLGNFVNRALKFCKDFLGGRVTPMRLTAADQTYLVLVTRHLKKYVELMEKACERESISQILFISRLGNQLMQSNKPWLLVKPTSSDDDRRRAGTVVSLAVNTSCLLAMLMEPFMPNMTKELMKQLNVRDLPVLEDKFRCWVQPGHAIGQPAPLVREIKPEEIEKYKQMFAGKKDAAAAAKVEKSLPAATSASVGSPDPEKAKALEKEVSAQGDAVRKLKEGGADKDAIKTEVAKLLELKKQLALAEGKDPNEKSAGGGGKGGKKGKGKKK